MVVIKKRCNGSNVMTNNVNEVTKKDNEITVTKEYVKELSNVKENGSYN